MAYDATRLADWEIARAVERDMPTPSQWADRLGLEQGGEKRIPPGF